MVKDIFQSLGLVIEVRKGTIQKKERYMKSPAFSEMNKDGFEVKIACDKLVNFGLLEVLNYL